jgi:hypothetical protein
MSHFYRLYTVNNTSQHAKLGWQDYQRASGIEGTNYEFEKGFEEIPLDPPWPHCKMYRAPLISDDFVICTNIFKYTGEIEMPEIWGGATIDYQ